MAGNAAFVGRQRKVRILPEVVEAVAVFIRLVAAFIAHTRHTAGSLGRRFFVFYLRAENILVNAVAVDVLGEAFRDKRILRNQLRYALEHIRRLVEKRAKAPRCIRQLSKLKLIKLLFIFLLRRFLLAYVIVFPRFHGSRRVIDIRCAQAIIVSGAVIAKIAFIAVGNYGICVFNINTVVGFGIQQLQAACRTPVEKYRGSRLALSALKQHPELLCVVIMNKPIVNAVVVVVKSVNLGGVAVVHSAHHRYHGNIRSLGIILRRLGFRVAAGAAVIRLAAGTYAENEGECE